MEKYVEENDVSEEEIELILEKALEERVGEKRKRKPKIQYVGTATEDSEEENTSPNKKRKGIYKLLLFYFFRLIK